MSSCPAVFKQSPYDTTASSGLHVHHDETVKPPPRHESPHAHREEIVFCSHLKEDKIRGEECCEIHCEGKDRGALVVFLDRKEDDPDNIIDAIGTRGRLVGRSLPVSRRPCPGLLQVVFPVPSPARNSSDRTARGLHR